MTIQDQIDHKESLAKVVARKAPCRIADARNAVRVVWGRMADQADEAIIQAAVGWVASVQVRNGNHT